MKRLEEIEERVKAATLGPWDWSDYGIYSTTQIDGLDEPGTSAPRQICSEVWLRDVPFIVHAREDVPYLLDKLKRAIKVMEYYQHDEQIGQRARDFLKEVGGE